MQISINSFDWKDLDTEKPGNGQECLLVIQDEDWNGGKPMLLHDVWAEGVGFFYIGKLSVKGWLPIQFELPPAVIKIH